MSQPPIVPGRPPGQPYHPLPPRPVVVRGPSATKVILIVAGCIVGLVVLVFGGLMLAGSIGAGIGNQLRTDMDVQITACQHSHGIYTATVEVTNRGNATSPTLVRVTFLDSTDTRLAQGSEYIASLAPGQSAREEVVGFGPEATTSFSCVLER